MTTATATANATRTSKTRTPAKTAEEKKAQAEALHQSIVDQVEALRDSGRWEAFLDFAQAFHAYSTGNGRIFESPECPVQQGAVHPLSLELADCPLVFSADIP